MRIVVAAAWAGLILGMIALPLALWPDPGGAILEFAHRWGNLAGMIGLVITVFGFSLTLGEQRRIRKAVAAAIGEAALSVLGEKAEEVERLLREFRDAVREQLWGRAAERCEDASSRLARLTGHQHLESAEKDSFGAGVNDLRSISAYLSTYKILKATPPRGFDRKRMEAVDRLTDALNGSIARTRNRA